MSPFLPHHTHSAQHPKYAALYYVVCCVVSLTRRLMDGVRRWMSATPPPGTRTSRVDRTQDSKLKSKKPRVEPESTPETLPEVVMRLLDPIVKEEEEYQEWVRLI